MTTFMHATAVLAGLACLPQTLGAQERPWSGSVSILQGLDGLEKVTGSRQGISLGIAREQRVLASQVHTRLGLSILAFPGKASSGGLTTSLRSLKLSGDVILATPIKSLSWITGLSFNRYWVANSGTPLVDAKGIYQTYWTAVPDSGLKLGLRMGFTYRLNARWAVEALYEVTELGRTPEKVATLVAPEAVKGPTNPSWLQVGVNLRF